MKPRNLYSAIASAALVAGCPAISHAAIEEIIVTARKSEESLQQTPVAVTALNEVMMLNRQVTEIADLRRTAPNLSILSGGTGPSSLVFVSIRGAAQVSPGGAADASVGTYIDGVYHARPTGGNLDMFDTRQVEVLRGPQGTLFGRNTTGGALNVRTNDPVGDFEGYLKVDVGNYESRKLEGVVNVPLMGDELAVRLAFRDSERDGFGDYKPYTDPNGYSMPGLDQEASAIDKNSYGRIKIKWEPAGKNFTAMLNGWWSEFEDTGQRSEVQAINDAIYGNTLAGIFAVSGFNSQHFIAQQRWNNPQWNADLSNFYTGDAELLKPMSTNENSGVALELDIELGDYMLKSISAYSETFSVGAFDLDGIPLSFQNAINEWDQEQWSQELQLSGSVGEKIDWIGGLYYFEETSTDFARSRSFGDVAAFFPGVPIEFIAPISTTTAGVFDNTSFGAFFQGNYQFSEALRGTVGVRYTRDKRDVLWHPHNTEVNAFFPDELANCSLTVAERDDPGVCAKTDSVDFEYPAWVVGLDYQLSDNLFVYAKTSGASMSGGWNVRATTAPSFEPENVTDIELGLKSDLFDDRLRLNAAVFHIWYDDQQRFVNELDPVTNTVSQYVQNAGKSTAQGAEFELTLIPWEGMTLTGTLSLLDTEYDKYEVLEPLSSGPNAGQGVLVDHSGEESPQAPEMSFTVGATQIIPTALGEVSVHADYFWVDDTYFQDNTVRPGESAEIQAQQREEQKYNAIPSYGLVNAMAKLTTSDGRWEFSLWGRNLADKEYYKGVANFYTAIGTAVWFNGDPRTYGVSARYNW